MARLGMADSDHRPTLRYTGRPATASSDHIPAFFESPRFSLSLHERKVATGTHEYGAKLDEILNAISELRDILRHNARITEGSGKFKKLRDVFERLSRTKEDALRTFCLDSDTAIHFDDEAPMGKWTEDQVINIKTVLKEIARPARSNWPRQGLMLRKNDKIQQMVTDLDVMRGSFDLLAYACRPQRWTTNPAPSRSFELAKVTLRFYALPRRTNSFGSMKSPLHLPPGKLETPPLLRYFSEEDMSNLGYYFFDLGRYSTLAESDSPSYEGIVNTASKADDSHNTQQENPLMARHLYYQHARLEGTCEWILESLEYVEWHKCEVASSLWVYGTAGVGKSTLMSMVVDRLAQSQDPEGVHYAYAYMTIEDVQKPGDLVATVLQQLMADEGIVRKTLPPKPAKVLIDTWHGESIDHSHAFDLLQECSREFGWSLLIFSRASPPSHIENSLWVTLERNKQDICQLLNPRLQQYASLQYWWTERFDRYTQSDGSTVELAEYLANVSGGRFLHTNLQAARLLTQRNMNEMNMLADRFHDQIALFDWALNDLLQQQSADLVTLARRTLTWLSLVEHPVNCLGLCQALTIAEFPSINPSQGGPTLRRGDILNPDIVVSCCKGLVRMDSGTWDVVISDSNIRTRVLSIWKHQNERVSLASACTSYLLLKDFGDGLCFTKRAFESRLRNRPFLSFASRNWLRLSLSEIERAVADNVAADGLEHLRLSVSKLLQSGKHLLSAVQAMLILDSDDDAGFLKKTQSIHSMSLLKMTAAFGLSEFVETMLKRGSDSAEQLALIKSPSGHYYPVDDSHVLFNRLRVCLFGTADLKTVNFTGSDPHLAEDAVRSRICSVLSKPLILELLCSDKSVFSDYTTEIIEAAASQHMLDMVAKVLDWIKIHQTEPALDWTRIAATACEQNNNAFLSILLERQLLKRDCVVCHDQSQTRCSITTPLQIVCRDGHYDLAKMLVEYNVNLEHPEGPTMESPLIEAIKGGHKDIVSLLLRAGVSVASANHQAETPLHIACERGDDEIASSLLRHGADPNSRLGEKRGSPLMEAVKQGHERIVLMLLHAGALINRDPDDTPLHVAVKSQNIRILSLLLASVADVHIKDNLGKDATMYANGDKIILELFRKYDYS